MRKIRSHLRFVMLIFFGIAIGFLLAFLIFNLKSVEIKSQTNSSDNKAIGLQNQKLLNISADLNNIKDIYANITNTTNEKISIGLLSPRIYAGILEPRSFLITNFKLLESNIESYLKEQNISASIYVENLRNGVNIGINEDEGYFPASLNKLPVAVLIMQKIEDGKLSLDSMLPIEENDRTDSYGTLYLTKENQLPVKVLLEKMLRGSDNTAFNVLFEHVDRSELARLLNYYNLKENIEYPFKRLEYVSGTNLVTPIEMYNLFSSLYLSTVLYAQDSEYILSLLVNTEFDIKKTANLPDDVTVAHKFGEYYLDDTKLFHDCGLMYIGQSRIFYCIMMRDIEIGNAEQSIGYLVNYIYNYIVNARTQLDTYKPTKKDLEALNSSNYIR